MKHRKELKIEQCNNLRKTSPYNLGDKQHTDE